MKQEKMGVKGRFKLICRDADGKVKWRQTIDNAVMNGGFDFILDAMFKSAQPSEMTHVGIGSSNTAVAATQTALQTELAREAAVYAHATGTKVATMTATFGPETGTGTVREVGVFNGSAAGTMLARALLSPQRAKAAGDALEIEYTFTLSQQ